MKRLLIIAGVLVGVLVLAVVLVPLFINVDSFRPELQQKLTAALNRRVEIGKLSASIWSGGASAENISIADDPAFNKGPFLQASSLKVGLHLIPLIFSRRVEVTSLTVQKPVIVLLRNAAGKWNYSTLGTSGSNPQGQAEKASNPAQSASKPSNAPSGSSAPEVSVDKFEIVDGDIKVGQSGAHGPKEQNYQNVNLVAQNISFTTPMPFTLDMATPGGGSIKMEGQAGPLDRQDSSHTPFNATLKMSRLDLGATGFVDPSSGLAGVLDFDGKVSSDGHKIRSEGKAAANKLKIVKSGSPTNEPVNLDYESDYSLDANVATLHAGVHAGNSTATAQGTVESKGTDSIAHLKLTGKDMPVTDLAKLLPAFGIVLPAGATLQGGTANVDMTAEGPLDRLVIDGPVNISQTHLTGYNLAGKLSALAAFTNAKPAQANDTLIQTVSSTLQMTPEGIKADKILLDVPAIGQLTGNGIIDSKNALNFPMVLKLATGQGSALGTLATFGGNGQTAGIPFIIEGTTNNPIFRPNLNIKNNLKNALLGGSQNSGDQQQGGLGGVLGGLLKKKPQQKQ